MRCKCGCMMLWNSDYINGIFVSWYTCPSCGYDTRNQQVTWSDRTYKADKAESEDNNAEIK